MYASEEFEVYPGLIGTGEAVIADRESDIRDWLKNYHEKVLAVDMEAGGLSQYWQENSVNGEPNPGWIVIRGVSDNADQDKGHGFHELAARNAAYILRELLPLSLPTLRRTPNPPARDQPYAGRWLA
jgi:adenosylhomocysteine nucleosidase